MKIIAVIPARFAASRFPGKLMEKLGEKTVIRTTYEAVLGTGLFQQVIVATDSRIIFDEISVHGGDAMMTGAHETGSDRIAEAVQNIDADIVINVQGDEPFINFEALRSLIRVFANDAGKKISLASLKIKIDAEEANNPNVVKVVTDLDDFALYFSRAPIPFRRDSNGGAEYFRHIGVYAFRKEALQKFASLPMTPLEKVEKIECLRYLENGMSIRMVETDFAGVGIDVPEDLETARKLLTQKN